MRIGVPKEIKTHEYRVGLVPASVRELVHHGHAVMVETGAGAASASTTTPTARPAPASRHGGGGVRRGRDDREGEGAAARGMRDAAARTRSCSPICTSPPIAAQTEGLMQSGRDVHRLRDGDRPTRRAAAAGADERGRRAHGVQVGAHCLEKAQGGSGILLGGVPGVRAGQGRDHRRRRLRDQRRAHGDGHGGASHRSSTIADAAAAARLQFGRMLNTSVLDRATRSKHEVVARRPGDRRGAGAGRRGAEAGHARDGARGCGRAR